MSIFNLFSTDSAQRKLRDLEERVAASEREIKALRLEWEQTYDKVRHMMGRIAKRVQKAQDELFEEGMTPNTPPKTQINGGDRSATGGMLTPHQREVQQQILRRRAGLKE